MWRTQYPGRILWRWNRSLNIYSISNNGEMLITIKHIYISYSYLPWGKSILFRSKPLWYYINLFHSEISFRLLGFEVLELEPCTFWTTPYKYLKPILSSKASDVILSWYQCYITSDEISLNLKNMFNFVKSAKNLIALWRYHLST